MKSISVPTSKAADKAAARVAELEAQWRAHEPGSTGALATWRELDSARAAVTRSVRRGEFCRETFDAALAATTTRESTP